MVSLPICGNAGGLKTVLVCSFLGLGSLYRQSYVPSVGSREENAFGFFLDIFAIR